MIFDRYFEINDDVLEYMELSNGMEYNLLKASEEFQELSLVLLQKSLKPYKVQDQEIIDEMGDSIIRMYLLLSIFDREAVGQRIADKIKKYRELIKENQTVKI